MFLKAVHEDHYHDDKDGDIDLLITMTMMTLRMKSTIRMKMLPPVQKHSLICVPYLQTVIK